MSSILIAGDTSGSVTIAAPAIAGTTVITLPATTGTLISSGGALGTPSSGTLTNCTGLPVAGGGTGVTTSTGSGANVLGTSPTLTTPTISTITSAAATALTLQSASTTAVTIDTSQNVGIGTASPGVKLDVNGSILSRGNGAEGGEIDFNNPDNASIGMVIDVSAADTGRIFSTRNNSALQLGQLVGTGGSISLYTAAAERMRIDSSGNVGIGTASPAVKLDVSGVAKATTLSISGTTAFSAGTISADVNWGMYFKAATAGVAADFSWANSAATERMRIDSSGNLLFNSGYGSAATAYGCRAWVNFNGTGTVAIRASGNVSSITDNGTGDYTVNFTTAMPDANYSFVATSSDDNNDSIGPVAVGMKASTYVPTTTARRFETAFNGTNYDSTWTSIAVFR